MGNNKSIFSALTRVAVLLPSVFCAFMAVAQTSLPERLNRVLETQDMEMGIKLYNEITEADLEQLPDSVLFDYHYLGGYINSEIPDHEKAIAHLLEAKRLCDTSLGTHSGDYMEIMRGLGDEYIELGQYEEALAIYQESIIKSMYMREAASHDFGNLIMGVQDCCELLGQFNEIPDHLSDAWYFWYKDETPLVTYTYFPLWRLEQFYKRYGMYEKALSVSDQIETFIKSKGGENHPELASAFYMKGNILVEMKHTVEGIKAYQEGLTILRENKMNHSERYESIAGNLLLALIEVGHNEEFEIILREIYEYSNITKNPHTYFAALYASAKTYYDRGELSKAIDLNAEIFKLALSEQDKGIASEQKNTLGYAQEIINNFPNNEKLFGSINSGTREWFEVGLDLSNAYHLKKDTSSNLRLLETMYERAINNPTVGNEYIYWILNSLYNIHFDKNDFTSVLTYAKKIYDFVSSSNNANEYNFFIATNKLIAAKLRNSSIDDIDEDLDRGKKYTLSIWGKNSTQYATYLHNRGRAYQLQNKLDEAKETLLRSITLQNKLEGKPLERTVKYYMEVVQQLGEL